jgi:hypothetical protein
VVEGWGLLERNSSSQYEVEEIQFITPAAIRNNQSREAKMRKEENERLALA